MLGLFLDAEAVAVLVKFCHAVSLWIVHIVSEDARLSFFGSLHTLFQQGRETCAIEDVVAQYQAHIVIADKLLADDESLCQSVG